MTDYFNFLGLPKELREMIINEIVQNLGYRIQLALTAPYFNNVVKRKKLKKIIDQFSIGYSSLFHFYSNQKEYSKSMEELMEILPNCQIKKLLLADGSVFLDENYSEFLDMLSEAAELATKLDILSYNLFQVHGIVGFYAKLKRLKSVTLRQSGLILPSYPSKVKLKLGFIDVPENYLKDLAVKSHNCPLSFFELQCDVLLDDCQQFLQKAKFSIGADIFIHAEFFRVDLTYLGLNTFTLEMFSNDSVPILISQKFDGENRRILKLKKSIFLRSEFTFNVVSASNPEKNYFSGVFKEVQQLIILENVDRDDILIIKFVDERIEYRIGDCVIMRFFRPRYSAAMLESAFPTTNFTTPEERVETINNVLGTNIQLIQAEDFAQTVEIFLQDSLTSKSFAT